jgi:toxin ParE1/3/4
MRQQARAAAAVKKFEVVFRPAAEADLLALHRHVAEDAGLEIAGDYIGRIEEACLSPETSPKRGTARDDIRPGLRVMGFERRVTIVFQVGKAEVTIIRIFYGGQDYEWALRARR